MIPRRVVLAFLALGNGLLSAQAFVLAPPVAPAPRSGGGMARASVGDEAMGEPEGGPRGLLERLGEMKWGKVLVSVGSAVALGYSGPNVAKGECLPGVWGRWGRGDRLRVICRQWGERGS
jgi:hypothetical protein